jgi:soluble lytic murein transglycosylase-like protein
VSDVFDPKQNIDAGATYLRQLLDKYKDDLKLALAAYNAGPATVDKTGGIPDIKETQDYVEGILKKMK